METVGSLRISLDRHASKSSHNQFADVLVDLSKCIIKAHTNLMDANVDDDENENRKEVKNTDRCNNI